MHIRFTFSKNQIISFVIAIILSAFFYLGWDVIASGIRNGKAELAIQYIGINAHYSSLSKGVIDSRDILYFISLNTLFVLLTQTILTSRNGNKETNIQSLSANICILILANILASMLFFRLDLTSDKRHSLSNTSRFLNELDDISM